MPPRAAGVLLAAGEGRRLGRPKALVRLGDLTLVERGARMLRDAGCDPVVVVLGAAADEVVRMTSLPDVVTVVNSDWPSGMASSLRRGLEACAGSPGAVIALVDQPGVTAAVVRRLVETWQSRSGGAVVAAYDGHPRNPVLLDASAWVEVLESAEGDVGARVWLRAHPEQVSLVECGDLGDGRDIDTAGDLADSPL